MTKTLLISALALSLISCSKLKKNSPTPTTNSDTQKTEQTKTDTSPEAEKNLSENALPEPSASTGGENISQHQPPDASTAATKITEQQNALVNSKEMTIKEDLSIPLSQVTYHYRSKVSIHFVDGVAHQSPTFELDKTVCTLSVNLASPLLNGDDDFAESQKTQKYSDYMFSGSKVTLSHPMHSYSWSSAHDSANLKMRLTFVGFSMEVDDANDTQGKALVRADGSSSTATMTSIDCSGPELTQESIAKALGVSVEFKENSQQ
jgi:hypothetical protein